MTALIKKACVRCFKCLGWGGSLVNDLKSVYANSKACERVRGEKSDWFEFNWSLR